MAVTRKTISVAWLEANNACNVEACRKYFLERFGAGFTDQTEVELTPEGIIRASKARLTPTNWLARRILDGPELEEYEREQKKALDVFEHTMAPVLAGIIARSKIPST
jgi:hypothetical protein